MAEVLHTKDRVIAMGPRYGATGVAAEIEYIEEHGYRASPSVCFCLGPLQRDFWFLGIF